MSYPLEIELIPAKEGKLSTTIHVTTATETFTVGVVAQVVAATAMRAED